MMTQQEKDYVSKLESDLRTSGSAAAQAKNLYEDLRRRWDREQEAVKSKEKKLAELSNAVEVLHAGFASFGRILVALVNGAALANEVADFRAYQEARLALVQAGMLDPVAGVTAEVHAKMIAATENELARMKKVLDKISAEPVKAPGAVPATGPAAADYNPGT